MASGYPDYKGHKVDIELKPDWSAYLDLDKSLSGTKVLAGAGYETALTYTVPAGKTLYILLTNVSGATMYEGKILRDAATIWNSRTETKEVVEWPIPLKFAAGEVLTIQGRGVAGNTIFANATGWEE